MDTCRRMLHSARLSTLLGVLVLLQWLVVPGLRCAGGHSGGSHRAQERALNGW